MAHYTIGILGHTIDKVGYTIRIFEHTIDKLEYFFRIFGYTVGILGPAIGNCAISWLRGAVLKFKSPARKITRPLMAGQFAITGLSPMRTNETYCRP